MKDPCPYCKEGHNCRDRIIAALASTYIHAWIGDGSDVNNYHIGMDRVAEIWELIEKAASKADAERAKYQH